MNKAIWTEEIASGKAARSGERLHGYRGQKDTQGWRLLRALLGGWTGIWAVGRGLVMQNVTGLGKDFEFDCKRKPLKTEGRACIMYTLRRSLWPQ